MNDATGLHCPMFGPLYYMNLRILYQLGGVDWMLGMPGSRVKCDQGSEEISCADMCRVSPKCLCDFSDCTLSTIVLRMRILDTVLVKRMMVPCSMKVHVLVGVIHLCQHLSQLPRGQKQEANRVKQGKRITRKRIRKTRPRFLIKISGLGSVDDWVCFCVFFVVVVVKAVKKKGNLF